MYARTINKLMQGLGLAFLVSMLFAAAMGFARADQTQDEAAVRALALNFGNAFIQKDAARRASLFTETGTFVTPPGEFWKGRTALQNEFGPEAQQLVNSKTQTVFSNFRIDFVNPDVAFVDSDLAVHNLNGPNGTNVPMTPIDFFYVAVRHGNGWLIQDGRAHFKAAPANGMMKRSQ